MQTEVDVCVIGGGILGCMAARELSRYELRVALIEKKEDVCTGITKANSAIIYAGYDHKPGTLKSRMCLSGNERMQNICEELEVPMKRCGSLMLGFGPESEKVLRKKLEQGKNNQVPGLELLTGTEVLALEPHVNPAVKMGLFAPTTGTVNPWELGIAAYEHALINGCQIYLHSEVVRIRKINEDSKSNANVEFELEIKDTQSGEFHSIKTKGILNCAGIQADKVSEFLLPPKVRIRPTKASYLVFSPYVKQKPKHILFYEPEEKKKKGISLVPTVDGSLLAGATEEKADSVMDLRTSLDGLEELQKQTKFLIPEMDFSELLCNFAGVRPNPYLGAESEALKKFSEDTKFHKNTHGVKDEYTSIHSFVIDQSEEYPSMVSLIGIKTPGLTCSLELAEYAISKLFAGMQYVPEKKKNFRTYGKENRIAEKRKTIVIEQEKNSGSQARKITDHIELSNLSCNKIICHCSQITDAEIRNAIHRGATTLEGIKHRCRTGMGRCQGSRCREKIAAILQEEGGKAYEKV